MAGISIMRYYFFVIGCDINSHIEVVLILAVITLSRDHKYDIKERRRVNSTTENTSELMFVKDTLLSC